MTDMLVVLTTCASAEEAERLARSLVESRLAACVAIGAGTRSFYHWQGKLEVSDEWSLTIKTRRDLFDRLSAELRRLHSYTTPELLALPVVTGGADYLDWMEKELLPPA